MWSFQTCWKQRNYPIYNFGKYITANIFTNMFHRHHHKIYTTESKPSVKRKAVDTNPCGGKAISKCELNHILFSVYLPTFNIVFLNL